MTLLTKIDRLPPVAVRLLARTNHGYRGLSHKEIALRSGIPKTTVADLSFKTTWAGIPVDVIDRFATACGVDFFHARHQVRTLLRRQKVYIYRAPYSQRLMYDKLFDLLRDWATHARTEAL